MTNRTGLSAGLLFIALAGCASTQSERSTSTNGSGGSIGTDLTPPNASSARSSAALDRLTEPSIQISGVVQSIELVHREDTGVEGSSVGAAAGDVLYRIIMRMDDDTVQTFEQETQPTYQNGDRVQVVGGVVGGKY